MKVNSIFIKSYIFKTLSLKINYYGVIEILWFFSYIVFEILLLKLKNISI